MSEESSNGDGGVVITPKYIRDWGNVIISAFILAGVMSAFIAGMIIRPELLVGDGTTPGAWVEIKTIALGAAVAALVVFGIKKGNGTNPPNNNNHTEIVIDRDAIRELMPELAALEEAKKKNSTITSPGVN